MSHQDNDLEQLTKVRGMRPHVGWPRVVVLFLALCSVGCGGRNDQAIAAEPKTVTFSRDIQPILDGYCVQCHMTGAAQGGLVLEDGPSYAMLVNARSSEAPLNRVKPGDPAASYLFLKLTGTHLDAGGHGLGMPIAEGVYKPLDSKNMALFRAWIQSGAKRD